MHRLHKYYIFVQRKGGNGRLPTQAHALLTIIEGHGTIEQRQLLKCMAFNNQLKTKQKTERILTYYAGFLTKLGCIEVLHTAHMHHYAKNQERRTK